MIAEPYKIKEVKTLHRLMPFERANLLRDAFFNTFRIRSDLVAFDMIARGMSAWTHEQKAGFMKGDEAYAGSRNYIHLCSALERVLGIKGVVPAHNRIGAEKLIATTMIQPGQVVLHNLPRPRPLVLANGGSCVSVSVGEAPAVDLDHLALEVQNAGEGGIAYLYFTVSPFEYMGRSMSLENLRAVRMLASEHALHLVLDVSDVFVLAVAERERGDSRPLLEIARETIALADIVVFDGSQESRSDVGAVVASSHDNLFETMRSQVVVFEGLHTYGGMSGRAMEVFAIGVEELPREENHLWYAQQIRTLHDLVAERGVPVLRGGKGIGLDAGRFLEHLPESAWRKFALSGALYLLAGIRPPIDGLLADQCGAGNELLFLELPRCSCTISHLKQLARGIAQVWNERTSISGLHLIEPVTFADEARFEPLLNTFFPGPQVQDRWSIEPAEPFKIAITEPIATVSRERRLEAIEKAGYNTFLLDSADVYIDFLTDSGVPAQSCYQWEGMTNTSDSPYSSPAYFDLIRTMSENLGYKYIIPTHQGRAAEHIMSQCMIKKGQLVPGNMYFTTTKAHQEMAGGIFRDVIVDEANDPVSLYPWKGNVDLDKMEECVREVGGPEGIAYLSYELCVNLAGGQPVSMDNAREVSRWCQQRNIPVMYDATRCVENAYMIQKKDPRFRYRSVRDILRELMSYGDGCTISCKKDFLVNMGGILACNSPELAHRFQGMLRTWEGEVTNGGLDSKDMVALQRGLLDSLDDDYIRARVEATAYLGEKLVEAGIPIVLPPGSHAIFLDARRFLPHIDQEQFPAQALAAAIFIETGVRAMERGNVSKGRNPKTGENYRPKLELVRLTIPRRVYSLSHMDYVVQGLARLWERRDQISGLEFTYEPKALRFFQGRFKPVTPWAL